MSHLIAYVLTACLGLSGPAAGAGAAEPASPVAVTGLACEFLSDPLGIDVAQPRLSWRIESSARGARQTAYQVLVASTPQALGEDKGDLWDSGKVASDATAHVAYAGKPPASHQQAFWKVRVWDAAGNPSAWSAAAKWSMGLLDAAEWKAAWIGSDAAKPAEMPWVKIAPGSAAGKVYLPATYVRKDFLVPASAAPVRAVLYVTTLGVVEPHLNGRRVGDEYFTPGWTDYKQRLYYRAYDVTGLVKAGPNTIGAILGDGWFRGNVSNKGQNQYGHKTRLMAQLHLFGADGTQQTIASDATWQAGFGPILESDMQAGETYDARREVPGWDEPCFSARRWPAVDTGAEVKPKIEAYPGVAVRKIAEIKAVAVTEPRPGLYVVNMGQNFAGWVRLAVSEPAGTAVVMRFGEMLNADGTVYRENLRSARATDTYVCKGGGPETWEPHLTFHGFQYVQVEGPTKKPGLEALTGVVASSDAAIAGEFESSSPLVNKIFSNTLWGQRSNYFEVPTDCPQRDERLGWTGDTQVFVRTGAYNMDVAAFFTKWMTDLADAQTPEGALPIMAPSHHPGWSPGWSDAGVVVPWTLYHVYGDTRLLQRHYAAMARHVAYYKTKSPGLIGPKEGFGDWLAVNSETSKDLIATAYFAHSARLLAEMAAALGKKDDAAGYRKLFEDVRVAFQKKFFTPEGRMIETESQTGYLLALRFDLLTADQHRVAAERLVADIDAKKHLATGFLGVNLLLPTLTDIGRTDLAYGLLQNTTYPSWGYSIEQGATTIWERWNSYTKDAGFGPVSMNSFNHYAYGSCVEWIYRTVLGIDALEPGFRRILIRPAPGGGLTWARGHYDSLRGRIATSWKIEGDTLSLDVTLPANTSGEIHVPAPSREAVTEGGRPATQSAGLKFLRMDGGAAVFDAASGSYRFGVKGFVPVKLPDWR